MPTIAIEHQTKTQSFLKDFLIVLGLSFLLGVISWIKIPLPFSPVPISFTVQAILLFSLLLGRKGALATTLYFIEGAIGFPVFSGGGCGAIHLLGPTGGYLVGWVVASWVLSQFSDRLQNKGGIKPFGLMVFGNWIVYFFGVAHLAFSVGISNALIFGLVPFIFVDLLKVTMANQIFQAVKK